MKQIFQVTGMSCAACANHVEKAVSKLDGVEAVGVNLMLGSMSVTYDENTVSDDAIIEAVVSAGYGAQRGSETDRGRAESQQDKALLAMRRRLLWSVVLLVPLFYLAMGHMISLPVPQFFFVDMRGFYAFVAVQLALLIPILILNRAYFTVGFSRLVKLSPNMDTLVALGAAGGCRGVLPGCRPWNRHWQRLPPRPGRSVPERSQRSSLRISPRYMQV